MVSFHACAIAVTVLVIGADALLAARRVDAQWVVRRSGALVRRTDHSRSATSGA